MKNYILVHLIRPEASESDAWQTWRAMTGGKLHNRTVPALEKGRLAENVWMLDREDGVSVLAKIVSAAEEYHFDYKVRFLSEEVE